MIHLHTQVHMSNSKGSLLLAWNWKLNAHTILVTKLVTSMSNKLARKQGVLQITISHFVCSKNEDIYLTCKSLGRYTVYTWW